MHTDQKSLDAVASRTKVIISAAGPYALIGIYSSAWMTFVKASPPKKREHFLMTVHLNYFSRSGLMISIEIYWFSEVNPNCWKGTRFTHNWSSVHLPATSTITEYKYTPLILRNVPLGTTVVDACVRSNTHYCDITGEGPWVRTIIDLYHEDAYVTYVHTYSFD